MHIHVTCRICCSEFSYTVMRQNAWDIYVSKWSASNPVIRLSFVRLFLEAEALVTQPTSRDDGQSLVPSEASGWTHQTLPKYTICGRAINDPIKRCLNIPSVNMQAVVPSKTSKIYHPWRCKQLCHQRLRKYIIGGLCKQWCHLRLRKYTIRGLSSSDAI